MNAQECVDLVKQEGEYRDELKDLKWRTGLANKALHSLLPVMKSRELQRQTKIRVYKELIRSFLW